MPTQQDIEMIAEKAAAKAVATTLLSIGIDIDDPLEAQREFFLMREVSRMAADAEFRKDMEAIRVWRKNMDEIKSKGIFAAMAVLVTAIFGALWIGIKQLIHHQ